MAAQKTYGGGIKIGEQVCNAVGRHGLRSTLLVGQSECEDFLKKAIKRLYYSEHKLAG